jgi:uncharacterized membrane protein (UPF0127 family)
MKNASAFGALLVLIGLLAAAAFLFPSRTSSDTATFAGVSLKIEYALTPSEREKGLGGRQDIPDYYGMLFVFPRPDFYGFWMKDTLVPLDIFWLDGEGKVVTIAENVMPDSYPNVFYPEHAAQYVLETRAGFARAYGVAKGTPLVLKNLPSVSE